MQRPLATVGFSYLLALVTAVMFLEESAAVFIAVLSFVLGIGCLFIKSIRKRGTIPAVLLTVAVAFGSFAGYTVLFAKPVETLSEKDAVITAVVCELPYKDYGRFYYTLETESIALPGVPQKVKLRVSTGAALEADIYDKLTARVHFYEPSGGYGYSSKQYYASKGIFMNAFVYDYEGVTVIKGSDHPLNYYALKAKSKLLESIRTLLPQRESSLCAGIFLGDKSELDDAIVDDFRSCGVSHLMAVSGLHLAILTQFMLALFAFFKITRKLSLSIVGILLFTAITGFSPSVMRGSVMIITYLLGLLISRKSDSLTSLGLAALLLTLPNPYAAGDIGLQLSFAATLGCILLSPVLEGFFRKKIEKLKVGKRPLYILSTMVSTTLSATVFLLPISIMAFGEVSLIAPLANVLMVYPATILLICTELASLLFVSGIFTFLSPLFACAAGFIAKYMIGCAGLLSGIPYASVSASQRYIVLWLAATFLLVALALYLRKNLSLVRLSALLSAILLLTGVFSHQLMTRNQLSAAVVSTGDGYAVVLHQNGRAAVLLCDEGKMAPSRVSRYLKDQNIGAVDYMLLPTRQDKSPVGTMELIEALSPAALCYPEGNYMGPYTQGRQPDTMESFSYLQKTSALLWDGVSLRCQIIDEKDGWISFSINDILFLLAPSGADAEDLPQDTRTGDILVLPDNAAISGKPALSAAVTIVAAGYTEGEKARGIDLRGMDTTPYVLENGGRVVVEFTAQNTIRLKGE